MVHLVVGESDLDGLISFSKFNQRSLAPLFLGLSSSSLRCTSDIGDAMQDAILKGAHPVLWSAPFAETNACACSESWYH